MKRIRLLMVNYYNKSLIRELAGRGYDVTAVTHISQLAKRGYGVSISSRNDNRVASESFINKFDLIYFAKIYPPVWDDIELLFRRNKIPIIYAFHFPALNNHPYRLKNHIFNLISIAKILNIKIAGHIPGLHVLNSNDYQVLTSLGLKCYSVPLGVDAEQFRQGVKNDAFTVVFSAIDSTYAKGVDMLTKIIPELIRKAPGLKILFIGGLSSPRLTSLKSLFKENIDVVAFLPQEQFAKHLGSSHVLLFPSRFEAFGLTALEALSCGLPVVCFDVLGISKDIVKKNAVGAVAKPFKTDEIVNFVLGYYEMWRNEPEKYERLSTSCRETALQYDWRIIASHFDKMFREILNERS